MKTLEELLGLHFITNAHRDTLYVATRELIPYIRSHSWSTTNSGNRTHVYFSADHLDDLQNIMFIEFEFYGNVLERYEISLIFKAKTVYNEIYYKEHSIQKGSKQLEKILDVWEENAKC